MNPRGQYSAAALGLALFMLLNGATAGSSQTVDVPPRWLLAYTHQYYYCPFVACNAYGYPNANEVVTPYSGTGGTNDFAPTWSPDGTRIAFGRGDEIAVMDAAGGSAINLTNTTAVETFPAWSPDGTRIAFVSDRDGQPGIFLMSPDGANIVAVPSQVGVGMGRPSWSPDGRQLAFECIIDAGNDDICVMRTDGSGLVRLTNDPARDIMPAWGGLAGDTIAFSTLRFGLALVVAVMNTDGTGFRPIVEGWNPAWSPDGRWIALISNAFDYAWGLYALRPDGSELIFIADFADSPAWFPSELYASFMIHCEGLACNFDASSSLGSMAAFSWDFGDGTTASSAVVAHTFADGGSYTVTLTVTDSNGSTATTSHTIYLNRPPVAAFTYTCETLTCTFDWSASRDPDGSGLGVSWDFGDGTNGWISVGPTAGSHKYPRGGTYTATLSVSDSYGMKSTASQTLVVTDPPPMHVGDIDRMQVAPGRSASVAAVVTVHDQLERPLANVQVTALWSDQTRGSCWTNQDGSCSFSKTRLKPPSTETLTISSVAHPSFVYNPAANHDPDGDSNGTSITLAPR